MSYPSCYSVEVRRRPLPFKPNHLSDLFFHKHRRCHTLQYIHRLFWPKHYEDRRYNPNPLLWSLPHHNCSLPSPTSEEWYLSPSVIDIS